MQISNATLLQYTVTKKNLIVDNEEGINSSAATTEIKSNINVSNTQNVQNISGVISTEALNQTIEKVIKAPENTTTPTVINKITTYKNLPQGTVDRIKQIIYDMHFRQNGGGSGGSGVTPNNPSNPTNPTDPTDPTDPSDPTDPTDPTDPDAPELENPDPTKASFMDEFNDTTSMFEYISTIDSTVTPEGGLSRAQIIQLSQRDDWEDSNYDFFGSLNRVFNILDTNSDGILSFNEIKEFIGDEIGNSSASWMSKVNTYAAQLESQYQAMSDQKKLEFVIARTEEYLAATGLTDQLAALNRLKGQTDRHCTVKVGQIGFRDLNEGNTSPYMTLGSYTYMAGQFKYDYNGSTYSVAVWAGDSDTATDDLGITLDISLLDGTWYNLVDVLVHELTHATASAWYDTNMQNGELGSLTTTQIRKMYDAGMMTTAEYNSYISKYNSNTLSDDEVNHLFFLACCGWGEYAAYQVDADYVDSIAGDEYDAGRMTTAVDGNREKTTIESHIASGYNSVDDPSTPDVDEYYKEPKPDYEWWTYG